MVLADDDILSEGTFHNSASEIVDSHIKRLCADVSSLNDISLCSFVDYVIDETNFHITIDQTMRDVTNSSFSKQIEKKLELHLTEGLTLLTELTRGPAMFNESREMNCRALLPVISIKTSRNVAKHSGNYRFNQRLTYRGFCTSSNHDEDSIFSEGCLNLPKSLTDSRKSFALQSQIVCVDPDESNVVQDTVCQGVMPVEETGDIFEAWMDTIGKQALARQEEKGNEPKGHRLLDKLYSESERQAKKKLIRRYIRDKQDNTQV